MTLLTLLNFGESYLIYSRSDIYGRWTKNRVKADDPWELTVKLDSRKDLKWTVHEIGRPWNKKLNVPRDRNWTIFQTRRSRGMNSHLEHLWVYLVGHLGKKTGLSKFSLEKNDNWTVFWNESGGPLEHD